MDRTKNYINSVNFQKRVVIRQKSAPLEKNQIKVLKILHFAEEQCGVQKNI